ncbi:class I tRNA ligase family protein [endosymbiont GvMRE of Glomus versiforme]|uniref:class I tRNA ligase family protein n=1 Tax=endosymbiont GvMRE of Glomus versiforme TaxID=2039283 RepID=UPI000EE8B50F|nr:class I tRNA ligase family protein [endosymbiont GvMRE of Glomus versiforme]RHZ35233.1 Methionine--tRNA ligase [endosymbiont GvMRE of Glomus versiforme]
MTKFFYITTPIFYPNDCLHLGHAYTVVLADIIARYKKSQGYQVYLQTGSDEHGEKIEKKASSLGISPQELVDKNVLLFQQLWKELGISEHIFYRTSSKTHKEKVQIIFTELLNRDYIYLGEYQGKYCVACEDYVSNDKVIDNNFCPTPNCQTELRKVSEPAYFLRVSKYHPELVKYYSQNPDFLLPPNIKKELFKNFLKNDIRDLCITRSDIKWGIPVPNNEKMVIYVWFEALLNYLNSEPGEKFFLSEFSEKKKIDNVKEVACAVIQNKNGEYLLVYNKKYSQWQFPGGKLEKRENAEEATKREIFEETNLVIEDLEKIGEENFYINNNWWKFHFYRTKKYSGEPLIKEKETIGEIKFFKISEIEKINSQLPDRVNEYLLKKLKSCEIVHLIGKEITRFHAIYWPIILFSLHKRLPNKILAHGWLTTPQGKMSKSKGNVIDPLELLKSKKYPKDFLRAYFIAKINFLQDGVCDEDLLKDFYHYFFVNNLSNLVSRVNKMLHLYNGGVIPELKGEVKNEKLVEYKKSVKLPWKNFKTKWTNMNLRTLFLKFKTS